MYVNHLKRKVNDQMSEAQVIEKLKNEGCRITKQRRIILEVILKNDFSSCKDIYYQVAKIDSDIGMATVYRMIRQLEDFGVITRIETIKVNDSF